MHEPISIPTIPPPARAPGEAPALRHPRLRSMRVRVGGERLYVRHHPGPAGATATPIVLVHGLGVSGTYHTPLARRLAASHPVWVPDLPGHGRSDGARRPLDVAGLAVALLAWMDTMSLARPLLLGQSLGCQVVAALAARHPERAAALILVSPTPDPHARTVPSVLLRLLADVRHERPALIPVVVADYLRAGPRLLWAEYRAMLRHPMVAALRRVRAHGVPCAVVRGTDDPVVGAAWTTDVARLAGAPAPVHVPDAGHAVQFSAPGEIVAAMARVLAR
jgi:2-hydroxy-6-oxonona-2,4-dienedioate hydrolase